MKITAFALAALAASATVASASNSYVALQAEQERDFRIELDLVRAATDAQVEIYALDSGELLGTTDVRAGANTNVYVPLDMRPNSDVRAVITANGQILSEDRIRIE
jgi:hypothetical protein